MTNGLQVKSLRIRQVTEVSLKVVTAMKIRQSPPASPRRRDRHCRQQGLRVSLQ